MFLPRLITTKFNIPRSRANQVERIHLLGKIDSGRESGSRLTLICAPAGYGKTTLASEWVKNKQNAAWLSLSPEESDPVRFLVYLTTSLQKIDINLGESVQNILEMPQVPPLEDMVNDLIKDLGLLKKPVVLVLDDYHTIHSTNVHDILNFLVDNSPENLHLVITTREDPPIPLSRLRARGQMTEIRAIDLRFSSVEACKFFSQTMRLELAIDYVNSLEARTEGWVSGLQLAGLALQNLANPQEFIENFKGSHRYILDYLGEEVIHQQSEEVIRFLKVTSVLERMNASLCQALTGRMDSQAILQQLEQANLFIIPLDDERYWYRYHHLFADYLRGGLTKKETSDLNQKAALWHEENNQLFEGVRYAIASGNMDFAASVIERALKNNKTWSGGHLNTLTGWLDALPPQVLQNRPQLSLDASRILYLTGRFDQAEIYITQSEELLKTMPVTPEVEQMLSLSSLYRGSIASVHGDVQKSIELITFAQSRLSRENYLAHARAFFDLGLAYEISDQTDDAVTNYLQSSQEAKSAGVLFLAVHALCAAAQVQINQGRLNLAEQTCQDAVQLVKDVRIPPVGLAYIVLGGIALQRNNLSSAAELLQEGIALSRKGGLMDNIVLGLSHLAHLYAIQGNSTKSFAVNLEATKNIESFSVPRMSILAAANLARLQLYTGQKQLAEQWVTEYQNNPSTFKYDFAELTLVRVLLAMGRLSKIPSILHPILVKSNEAGKIQTCIEVMMLLGLYHYSKKETESAVDWLGKSLCLAAPEGYIRVFLDEGKPLFDLLPKARVFAPEFVASLLSMSQSENKAPSTAIELLPVPLSDQELRVLLLVVSGKSNQEIALELFISVGTAKWHVHNVFQKLSVSNRPQAIARARELGF